MNHPTNNPHHDRLDLKLSALDYSDKPCGAINMRTKKPEYCDFECPTLHGLQDKPEPHWVADPARVAAREAELAKAALQPSTEKEIGAPVPGVPKSVFA